MTVAGAACRPLLFCLRSPLLCLPTSPLLAPTHGGAGQACQRRYGGGKAGVAHCNHITAPPGLKPLLKHFTTIRTHQRSRHMARTPALVEQGREWLKDGFVDLCGT
jgi:hypothetical protein